VPSHRRYSLIRLLLACAATCISCGLFVGQASAAAPPCADLQIESIVVSPTNPVQGRPANIEVVVHNVGTCTAGGFVTQFRTSVSSPTGPSESIPSLFPGESRALNLPFVFTASGNYEAVVQVDTGNAVAETNEANNLEIQPITVLPPGINLVLEKFSVSPVVPNPTSSVVQGRAAIASITVTNTGNVPAGPFVVQWTPYLFAKPLTKSVSGLAAGATTTVTMEYTFPFATTVNGTATADSTKQVKETDELDNSQTLKTVVQPPLPNLKVAPGGVHVQPAPAGSVSTMEVEVENNGNNPAGAFIVTWSPGPFIAAQSQQVNGLGEGERTTLSFSNLYNFAGNYEGTVTVDSTHVIPEVNESDNTAPTVEAVPIATIDLTITAMNIRPEEEQCCGNDRGCCDGLKADYAASTVTQGVPNTVTVTVQNLGNSPSGSFVTSWNPSSLGIIVPGNQTLTQSTGPLGPGESRELTFSFTYPKPGNFRSIGDADAFNNVKETNEANNERILNVTVAPAHIALDFVSPITFSPAQPVIGEKATASYTIRNDGPIASEAFAVQLTPQQEGFKQTQFVSGLNPGEERTFTFPVTYLKKGQFTATAVIDPFNQIVKTVTPDEESASVTVVPKSTTLKVTLDHLHVIKSLDEGFAQGSAEWHNIIFAIFDPSASCNLNVDNGVVKIKQTIKSVACLEERDDDVEPGDNILSPKSIQVTLLENGPLVAAVGALEEDLTIPDVPGIATFVSPSSQYTQLSGLTKVAGKGCKKISGFPDIGSTETINEGHCFDAYLGVSVLSHVGMSALAAPSATTEANEAVAKVFTWMQSAAQTAASKSSSTTTVTAQTISTPSS
jgi:subtilase family serine protease